MPKLEVTLVAGRGTQGPPLRCAARCTGLMYRLRLFEVR